MAEKSGHHVKILDCTLGLGWHDINKATNEFQPQIVGVTAKTPSFRNAVSVARAVKDINPEIITVVGGSHPTAMPEHAASAGFFDFLLLCFAH